MGAPGEDASAEEAGALHVFANGSDGWDRETRLTAADGDARDGFGGAAAVDGDTVAVAAPDYTADDDEPGRVGAVYVYHRSGGTWTQETKLSEGSVSSFSDFGEALALEGDTLVVGHTHSDRANEVHVYNRSSGSWTRKTTLQGDRSQERAAFGTALALQGDTLAVGAPREGDQERGAVYVFDQAPSTGSSTYWHQVEKQTGSDGRRARHLGASLALANDTIVAGAPRTSSDGAAYLFGGPVNWLEDQRVTPGVGTDESSFGAAVGFDGEEIVVGAPRADALGTDRGSQFLFEPKDLVWEQDAKFLGDQDGARRGEAVVVEGSTWAASAPREDGSGPEEGTVYVRNLDDSPPATSPGAGVLATLAAAAVALGIRCGADRGGGRA